MSSCVRLDDAYNWRPGRRQLCLVGPIALEVQYSNQNAVFAEA